jgi:hypothetical protein
MFPPRSLDFIAARMALVGRASLVLLPQQGVSKRQINAQGVGNSGSAAIRIPTRLVSRVETLRATFA